MLKSGAVKVNALSFCLSSSAAAGGAGFTLDLTDCIPKSFQSLPCILYFPAGPAVSARHIAVPTPAHRATQSLHPLTLFLFGFKILLCGIYPYRNFHSEMYEYLICIKHFLHHL